MAASDYPQLLATLENNQKIVYLCGAGASISLGEHFLSWPNWILAGKNYLSVPDQEVLEQKCGTKSTDELIDAVTFLLEKLKAEGIYEDFMMSTVGSLHPLNESFKDALKKIWRAGDLIATTNYDLTIEESVNAQSVSYSKPADILSVIKGTENKVIHLHGVYDRLNGKDDIVADDPQYQNILGNAGAQFIQNLISTHPLIIIGCGGTVEDPNLSGFMSFVVEKLGITDVPYFYLMKNGDAVPNLPANAIPVFYGDDYKDLPIFLSEISTLRLRKRSEIKGLASINPYYQHTLSTSAFGRMHFSNGYNKFTGREEELRQLNLFLENKAPFSWWTILGDGGIGKSRLVLEWLRTMPTRWFGFFTYKSPEKVKGFLPFTDTVIVFDYILGKEVECANTIQAYMDAFEKSPYRLRFLLIERNQESGEADWLLKVNRELDSQYRVEFEAGKYSSQPILLKALSCDEEISYVKSYLRVYLPLLPTTDFVEGCKKDIENIGKTIQEAFRNTLDSACLRPLYLSIFTEVWVNKEGNLSLNSVEELLSEYLNKEKTRWKLILGNDELVDSYLRLLSVACAIGNFNITDVYGDYYLKNDASLLTQFFDNQSRKPGADNVFTDLFVYMDEFEEDDGDDTIAEAFLNPSAASENVGSEFVNPILEMDKEERFAYFTPYIKLHADPQEVYLNMLANVGTADDEELEELKRVREERIKRVEALPDHAWIIEPEIPDIIKEFFVSYVVNDRDVIRFTKLARSNSILEFANFLTRALDDWKEKPIFQKMVVTPPDETLNDFEYYVGLLKNIDKIEDIRAVEQALIDSDPCFPKYEIELWRRIAIVLTERGDINRAYESARRFAQYLESLDGLIEIRDEAVDVIREYSTCFHNAGENEKHAAFLKLCLDVNTDSKKIAKVLCECYGFLVNGKLYKDHNVDIEPEWCNTAALLTKYVFPLEAAKAAMNTAHEYLITLIRKNDLEKLEQLESFLSELYSQQHIEEVAEIIALCNANMYSISYEKAKVIRSDLYEKVKNLYNDFPKSIHTRAAYISVARVAYLDTSSYRKVPDKILNLAKSWAEQYPNEIEFQEGYFGLLLARLEYAQANDQRNEQRRIFREMKLVAEKADYSEYNEENDMVSTVELLQMIYGY